MPEVSVIIPNYNHAKFLPQRIDSVLSQTYNDFEVIIMDDCSTDGSRLLIEQYRNHPKVSSIIYNETNSGSTFRQWEKGILQAKGKWIWIAESDDWCDLNFLEILMGEIAKNPDCVMAYCQSYCIDDNNHIRFQSHHDKLVEVIEGEVFVKKFMVMNNAIFNASMGVWKREVFFEISKEFTKYKFCGDWIFWIEVAKRGSVIISGRLMNFFRKHENDVSGNAYKTGLSVLEETEMVCYLHEQKIIDADENSKWMQHCYFEFLKKEGTIEKNRADKIKALFLKEKNLQRIEMKYRFKAYVKSYLKKLIR